MHEDDIKTYRSGMVKIRYLLGVAERKLFDDKAVYVLRVADNKLVVYSLLTAENANIYDILKALNIKNPTELTLVVNPKVEFSGNAYRFTDELNPRNPFLYILSQVLSELSIPILIMDGFPYGCFFRDNWSPALKTEAELRSYTGQAFAFFEEFYTNRQKENSGIASSPKAKALEKEA